MGKRENILRKKISQSMRDSGGDVTAHCKKLQRQLSSVQGQQKKEIIRQDLKRRISDSMRQSGGHVTRHCKDLQRKLARS